MKFQIDAKPVTFKARPYPKKQSEYLRSYLAKIEQLGLVLRNDQSHLSLPALPVRKGLYTNECLKTVDYTRVIRVLIPLGWSYARYQGNDNSRLRSYIMLALIISEAFGSSQCTRTATNSS